MPHPLLALLALSAIVGVAATAAADAADGAPPAAGPSPVPSITYTLDEASQVSLLLTRPGGGIARELLHAAPRSAGAHSESWDGLDEQGKAVGPGTYAWKLLSSHGLAAEYITTIGISPTPSFESWPGNHSAISSVAVDGTGTYLATGCGEGTILALKQTSDGTRRLWTIPHWLDAWCGPISMASDGGTLFMLQLNGRLYRTPCDQAAPKEPWNMAMPGDREASVFNEVSNIMDMDAGGGQLVLAYTRANLLRWIDPATGKQIATATVTRPLGVAIDRSDGSVLVISEDQVLRLARGAGQHLVVVPKGQLVGGWRLRVDAQSGDILVAENRQTQRWTEWQYFSPDHLDPNSPRARRIYYTKGAGYLPDEESPGGCQIKRFDRSGKLLASYGSPQGRQPGPHVATDFGSLLAIACNPDGGFTAVEQGLCKRTVRCDAHGAVLNEWFGGWGYGQHAVSDPADPAVVWITDRAHFIKTRLDLAHRTWHYLATYVCEDLKRWFDQDGPVWRIVHKDGSTYFALIGWEGMRGPCLLRLDEAHNRLVMAVASGSDIGQDLDTHVAVCAEPLLPRFLTAAHAGRSIRSWIWCDLNDDGTPQAGEISPSPWMGHVGGFWMDDDFTWCFHSQNDQLSDVSIYSMKPLRWTPGGVPVYRFPAAARGDGKPDQDEACRVVARDLGFSESTYHDAGGSYYSAFNHATGHDRNYGIGGWSARAAMNRVAKYSPDGSPQWVVGHHAPGVSAAPGAAHYLIRILGTIRGCVVVNDMDDGMSHVWDQDGLWVGRLLEHPVITAESPPSAYEQCGENFGGSLANGATADEVLYIGGSYNASPVYRITGWDSFRRQAGALTITPECAAALTAQAQSEAQRIDVAHIRAVDPGTMKLDGSLAKWSEVTPLVITDGDKPVAKVYLGWSPRFLYAAFDVTTTTPWANASQPKLAFQGGAAVDLDFGLLMPHVQAGLGDTRIVAAPIAGVSQVVEFYPVLAPDMSPPHFNAQAVYKTLVGEITFARAAPAHGGKDAVAVIKPDHSGYIVELRTEVHPPHELGPGYRMRFDASVIFADPSGSRSTVRLPWHSRSSEDTMINDTFIEAVLRPAGWGEAVLE
jgi:hypothetical protein